MRFRRQRYDPGSDLTALTVRLVREYDEQGKRGELTVGETRAANKAVRLAMEPHVIYAVMGRDRRKLTPQFAEDAERDVRGWVEQALEMHRSLASLEAVERELERELENM